MTKKNFKDMGQETVNKFFSASSEITHSTLVTPNTQEEQNTPIAPKTQIKVTNKSSRVQAKPRINMAFDEDLLAYAQIMARLDGCSITQYCNNLLRKDMEFRKSDYAAACKLFNK